MMQHPGEILATSGAYWRSCTLHAGVRLGIFDALAGGTATIAELAEKTGTDERAVGALADALAALGLLVKHDGVYQNSQLARTHLVAGEPGHIGDAIRHHANLVQGWGRLDEAVRSGAPVRDRSSLGDQQRRADFLGGMHNLASMAGPRVVDAIDLEGRRRLLDLGGGPGTYATLFCARYPELAATVFDLPTSGAIAAPKIDQAGLGERIRFVGGDYLVDQLPTDHDVAWLSHILHAEGPERCQLILDKTVAALEPGGLILIHEFILDPAKDGPVFPALFSLNMLLGTDGGRAYSEPELADMLAAAGVREIRRIPVDTPNDSGVMAGNVP